MHRIEDKIRGTVYGQADSCYPKGRNRPQMSNKTTPNDYQLLNN